MDSTRSISRADWLIGLLLGLLEVTVVSAFAIVLSTNVYGAGVRAISPIGLAVILLGTYGMAMLLFARSVPLTTSRLIGLATGLVLTLGVLRATVYRGYAPADITWVGAIGHDLWHLTAHFSPALTNLVFGLLCWWLGVNLATESFATERVLAIVRVAVVVLIGAFLIAGGALHAPTARDALARAVPLAFVWSLLALSLARLETVRKDATARTGSPPDRLPWIGTTLVTTGLLLIVALIVGQLLGLGFLGVLLADANALAGLLGRALYLVLLVFSYVIFFLLGPVIWLIRHAAGRGQQQQQQTNTNQSPFDQIAHDTSGGLPGWIVLGLNALFVGVVVIGALWVLYRALRRYRSMRRTVDVVEERESLWSKDLLLAGLRGAFARRRQARQRPPRPRERARTAETVREVYARVCAAAAEHGLPRLPAETPSEYAVRLSEMWPDAEGYWTVLTEAYRRVRYGGITPTAGEWRAVEAGWQQLRQRWAEGTLPSARTTVPASSGKGA
jgi:hypothetical protein